MSEATQLYLKRVLTELTTVAWQRRGGLSGDILRGLEARLQDSHLPPPSIELRKGLVPKLPDRGERGGDLRDLLSLEEGVHRRECLAREALWEAQVFQALAAADVERKRVVKRRSAKDERPLQAYGVDSIRAESLSGRLSREQVAANEFARRPPGGKNDPSLDCRGVASSRPGGEKHDATTKRPICLVETDDTGGLGYGGEGVENEDDEARRIVRDVRRRLHIIDPSGGGGGGRGKRRGGGGSEGGRGGEIMEKDAGGSGVGGRGGGRTEINNADLAEYLRVSKPECGRRSWALLSGMRSRLASQRRRRGASGVQGILGLTVVRARGRGGEGGDSNDCPAQRGDCDFAR
eukprot:jgi/Undpi1/2023/HiC_scaffold_12.g05409.m1